jgi:hypothetical protein
MWLVWMQVQIFAVGDAGALTERQVRLYKQHWQAAATDPGHFGMVR